MSIGLTEILIVIAGAALPYILGRLGIKVPNTNPTPVDPANPAPAPTNLAALIEAIVKAVLAKLLPQHKEELRLIVAEELANRPPAKPPQLLPEASLDAAGNIVIRPPAGFKPAA